MGAYLDVPNTEKHSKSGEGNGVVFGLSDMQGWRKNMEDAHIANPGLTNTADGSNVGLYAVFDGHGGAEVAKFCAKYLPDVLPKDGEFARGDYGRALANSFHKLDNMLRSPYHQKELQVLLGEASSAELAAMGEASKAPCRTNPEHTSQARSAASKVSIGEDEDINSLAAAAMGGGDSQEQLQKLMLMKRLYSGGRVTAGGGAEGDRRMCELPNHPVTAGCTAVVVLQVGSTLITANCGDSRGVLCRGGQAVPLSFDHKPNDDVERERIVAAGGFITENGGHFRINGNLNLSRSIGDLKYKQSHDLPASAQMITAEPDITMKTLQPDDEFMILACDGVWDIMSNEEAVQFVREKLQRGMPPAQICELVFDHCISDDPRQTRGLGGDNMTCVVVQFQH